MGGGKVIVLAKLSKSKIDKKRRFTWPTGFLHFILLILQIDLVFGGVFLQLITVFFSIFF